MEKQSFHRLSCSIETLRFPLILFIICLHCYTSTSSITTGHNSYFRITYFFSHWIGETGVPTYFFISGLLLFNSKRSYFQKLESRIKTLLVPYLFFNALILCGYIWLMIMGRPSIILEKDLAEYTILDYARAFWDRGSWSNGNGTPLLCPLWYIRNLILLIIVSPILYYIIKSTKLFFPLLVGVIWINTHNSAYMLQSLAMFSLGAYFPIVNKNPIVIMDRCKALLVSTFVFLLLLDIIHLYINIPFALPIHRFSLITNTFILICFCGEFLYRHKIYSSQLSKSSFFCFCIHYPLTLALRPIFERINDYSDIILVFTYLTSVVGIASVCVLIYKILRHIMPKFLNVITGNRG